MFAAPMNIRAITIVMREPRAWNFYGLAAAALLVEPGPSMLVSGMTSSRDSRCVISSGGVLSSSSCVAAISSGDGREIFSWSPGGSLQSAAEEGSCVSLLEDGSLGLASCRSAITFQVSSIDQLALPKLGDACVTVASEDMNSVAGFSVEASAAQAGHAAQNVVGSDESSYWAAAYSGSAIDLTVLLKSLQRVDAIEIDWEFAPRAFSVGVSGGGLQEIVFATSSNNLNATSIALSGVHGSVVRISISEPHPVFGVVGDGSFVGIRSVRVLGESGFLRVLPCGVAKESRDARDKIFFVAVPEFNPKPSSRFQDAAALAAATGNRLAGMLGELAAKEPLLDSCSFVQRQKCANCTGGAPMLSLARTNLGRYGRKPQLGGSGVVGGQGAVADDMLRALVNQARAAIAGFRH
jgi:hypothetical protein